MSEITVFSFEDDSIRTLSVDGEPWFIAADICVALDHANVSQVCSRLDSDEKGIHCADTLGGSQGMLTINESGLYSLILTSRKPEAKKFKKWVTSEVLPSIRKTGSYSVVATKVPALHYTPAEDAARAASAFADFLRLEGTSRAAMLRQAVQIKAPEYLALMPAYATNAPRTMDGKLVGGEGNSRAGFAATALLKEVGSPMTIHTFNKLVEAHGYLEVRQRPSTKHVGVARTFKTISEKGMKYGYNAANEKAKGSTQPLWFMNSFKDLLEILGSN